MCFFVFFSSHSCDSLGGSLRLLGRRPCKQKNTSRVPVRQLTRLPSQASASHSAIPGRIRRAQVQVQVRNNRGCGLVTPHLPDLDEVRPAVRDRKELLAEAGRSDRVRGAATVGRRQEEQLLRDGPGLGVQGERGDVAREIGSARAGRRVQVLWGGRGLAGNEDLVGPV